MAALYQQVGWSVAGKSGLALQMPHLLARWTLPHGHPRGPSSSPAELQSQHLMLGPGQALTSLACEHTSKYITKRSRIAPGWQVCRWLETLQESPYWPYLFDNTEPMQNRNGFETKGMVWQMQEMLP